MGVVAEHYQLKGLAVGIVRRGGERSRKASLSDEIQVFVCDKDVNQSETEAQPSRAAG
ncbi:hypothetical protein JEY40_07980 [Bradyrhizobium japonicum]|uniref:hypothetical protein n=1 Tax=Bradyrhizobium japonicum TaxID=375 RepID=UPI001CB70772|nr:hypothetical protein [Bradyrhizobium japonicum]UQD77660.1 hypothetical protein JEY40_07980 [Bradyrhizobium japonicum]